MLNGTVTYLFFLKQNNKHKKLQQICLLNTKQSNKNINCHKKTKFILYYLLALSLIDEYPHFCNNKQHSQTDRKMSSSTFSKLLLSTTALSKTYFLTFPKKQSLPQCPECPKNQ